MIKHIVTWKLQEENKTVNAAAIKAKLEALIGEIEEIKDLEVGIDFNQSEAAHDVLLYSTFKNKGALDVYQKHSLHVEAATFINSVGPG